jgi:hypothetical protein
MYMYNAVVNILFLVFPDMVMKRVFSASLLSLYQQAWETFGLGENICSECPCFEKNEPMHYSGDKSVKTNDAIYK